MQKVWLWVAAVLAVKLYFVFAVPLTGDEAYFIRWAHHLDFGYYDHPPMIGWVIWLLEFVSSRMEWFRLFAVFTSATVAWLLYVTLKPEDETRARLVALLFWFAPVNLLMVPLTNDTVLTLFGMLSATLFIIAFRKDSLRFALASGALLGLAFLSKYFAVVLFFGYLVYVVLQKSRRGYAMLAAVVVAALPFGLLNLYWNLCNCWDNIMFNLYNRHGADDGGWERLAIYLVVVVYFLMPWNLYFYKREGQAADATSRIYRVLFVTAFVFFALLSFRSEVGAHWLMLFIPFGFAMFMALDAARLKKMVLWAALFSLFHIMAIVTVLNLPFSFWEKNANYRGVVLFARTDALCEALEPLLQTHTLTAFGYTESALLSYHCGYEVPTLFSPSKFGRLDDKAFDARSLDQKPVAVFHANNLNAAEKEAYARYFGAVDFQKLDAAGAQFNIVTGEGFDYPVYKARFLSVIREKFYSVPGYLPMRACHFTEKYFPSEATDR